MFGASHPDVRVSPSTPLRPDVTLSVYDVDNDGPGIAIPRPAVHLVVRMRSRAIIDVHALGLRHVVHRKTIRGGQQTVTARLAIGASVAVLGVPASALANRFVALQDLWGAAAAERLFARLADTRTSREAAVVLERSIVERLAAAPPRSNAANIAVAAASRLAHASVADVADDLGVSERHLRRLFGDAVGMSPKAFSKLVRFRRAVHAARRAHPQPNWASIAADVGYYDQAHLIAEFRSIAGVTPRVLMNEVSAAHAIG